MRDAAGWAWELPGWFPNDVISRLQLSPLVLWWCGLLGLCLFGGMCSCDWTICADIVQPVEGWVAKWPCNVCELWWGIADGVL